jgi:hypothetical protein
MKKIFTITFAATAVKYIVATVVLAKLVDIGLAKLADKKIKKNECPDKARGEAQSA